MVTVQRLPSTGATTSLNIDQVGNSNVIKYQINGATYTGVINLVGNSNDVDLNCDSGNRNSSCGSVNAVLTLQVTQTILT